MKKSLNSLIKEFSNQEEDVSDLLKELFLFEDNKLYVNNPKYKSDYKRIIDSIVEKSNKN
jgi:hypothetical protein